jgi:tRNA uridine 5-carbamoylmethylation protein Kti12
LGISKAVGYNTSNNEKLTRGSIKSAIDHALNNDTVLLTRSLIYLLTNLLIYSLLKVVVVDSMNYIKGYRYELYCISRSVRTPHCVVWIECEDSISSKLNDSRSDKYEEVIFNDLRLRFEAPIEKNRWDMPLYRVNMTSTISETTGILPLASPAMKVSDESISNEDNKPTTVFSSWKKKQSSSDDQSCTNTVVSTFTTKTKSSDNTLTISGSSNKIINALQGPTPSRILHQLTNNTHSLTH